MTTPEALLHDFAERTGGGVMVMMRPEVAIAVLTALRHAIGQPGMSAHVSALTYHWASMMAHQFEAITPGVTFTMIDPQGPPPTDEMLN